MRRVQGPFLFLLSSPHDPLLRLHFLRTSVDTILCTYRRYPIFRIYYNDVAIHTEQRVPKDEGDRSPRAATAKAIRRRHPRSNEPYARVAKRARAVETFKKLYSSEVVVVVMVVDYVGQRVLLSFFIVLVMQAVVAVVM